MENTITTNDTNNNITTFNHEMFGNIRVRTINNEPWFVAKDVCDILELNNRAQALSRLDKDEISDVTLNDTSSNGVTQARAYKTVNEYGLYNLVLRSNKPEAKQFKRWITHEVLPSIRKHGMYITPEMLLTPDMMIKAMETIKAEQAARLKAEKERNYLLSANVRLEEEKKTVTEENVKLTQQAEENKPLVEYASLANKAVNACMVGEFAKILAQNGYPLGERRLFAWLRDHNYLISRGQDKNIPMQKYVDNGMFRIKRYTTILASGAIIDTATAIITPKGQQHLFKKIQKEFAAMA